MNYELAKQLKDAGFPLKLTNALNGIHIDNENYVVPTLSELIAACGEGFSSLVQNEGDGPDKFRWNAFADDSLVGDYFGKTPEEAVAKLWLALNQKNV